MEALTAVAVAGLTVVDMVKAVDPGATIESVRVERKAGGAGGGVAEADVTAEHFDDAAPHASAPVARAAVVVVSTRVAAGEATDHTGGPLVAALRSWGVRL